MAFGGASSSRGNGSRHGSSSRRRSNPHQGFHYVPMRRPEDMPPAPPEEKGKEVPRERVSISEREGRWLFKTYTEAPPDAKLPDGWHFNPNRVPIPAPPTGSARRRAIAEHLRLAPPELRADPRFAWNGSGWDELFEHEHELGRRSFFASSPPRFFRHESVTPPDSDDEDAAKCDADLYQRLPEEMPPPEWKGIPLRRRDPSAPKPIIVSPDVIILD